jgi:hypothetical protein
LLVCAGVDVPRLVGILISGIEKVARDVARLFKLWLDLANNAPGLGSDASVVSPGVVIPQMPRRLFCAISTEFQILYQCCLCRFHVRFLFRFACGSSACMSTLYTMPTRLANIILKKSAIIFKTSKKANKSGVFFAKKNRAKSVQTQKIPVSQAGKVGIYEGCIA